MAKVKVTQIKSTIHRPEDQKRTIKALGFRKLHQVREFEENPAIMGMIKKVAHLIKVETI
ncbi:MAG: 50S ribosomal protein L30 [Bacteroidia bacterium]